MLNDFYLLYSRTKLMRILYHANNLNLFSVHLIRIILHVRIRYAHIKISKSLLWEGDASDQVQFSEIDFSYVKSVKTGFNIRKN